MTENISQVEVNNWVTIALENENIKNYKVELTGTSEKGEGYATDIIFVKVTGSEKTSGRNKELNLVLKVGKDFKTLDRDQIDQAYVREMFLYDRVFPEYRNFQDSRNHQNIFHSGAKCIKTLNLERKIIVFENLRTQGYEPYDRHSPMNIDHIKEVLKQYALFHGIGFAYKDQRKNEFEVLVKDYGNMYKLMTESSFRSMFQAGAVKTCNAISEVDEELTKKLDGLVQKGIAELLETLFDKHVEESTITHGDCWSSNFLFKYENGNKQCPAKVAILDWQISSYMSPVIDLSYFLFIVSSKEQVAQFDNLLDYYYENLSRTIVELGSDPKKLFPRSKFEEHWKIFSTVGLFFACAFLELILCDKNDAPALTDCVTADDLVNIMKNATAKKKDLYLERILSLNRYYFQLQNE